MTSQPDNLNAVIFGVEGPRLTFWEKAFLQIRNRLDLSYSRGTLKRQINCAPCVQICAQLWDGTRLS